jgi:hypothetical protein
MTNGYFKIGKSMNPYNRVKTLKTANPMIAESVIILAENHEDYLHSCFKNCRIDREWFLFGYDYNTTLLEHIDTILKLITIALGCKKKHENPIEEFELLMSKFSYTTKL